MRLLSLGLGLTVLSCGVLGLLATWPEADTSTPRKASPPQRTAEPAAGDETSARAALRKSGQWFPIDEGFKDRLVTLMRAARQESQLVAQLRALEFSDPARSVQLAQRMKEHFPEGAYAPERAWYEARNLVYLQRFDEAREVAEQTYQRFPESSFSRDLRRHLLSHPFGLPPRDQH